jgi:GNAT superfamily N-acetyltransferase
MAEDELQTCEWLEGRGRDVARAYLVPALEGRLIHMQGRPYCLLTNLCTHPDFQRRGAAIALVEWGVNKADQLRVPAYLEASDVDYGLYAKLGFKKIDTVTTVIDGELVEEYPAMWREASIKSLP